ncbi:MAG: GTP cyclohydrolase II [Candidatus Micrarchaeia archaeon]
MPFASVEEALQDVKTGKPVIVIDDYARENEGDLVLAAEKATTETVAFMIREARGLFCVPMTPQRLNELGLDVLVTQNNDEIASPFTISVDAKNTSTGMSANDRLKTIKTLLEGNAQDLKRPGHVFPLKAHPLGVLGRRGHTEAAVDLAKLAGLYPAGAISEVINEDGSMARLPQLKEFAKKHDLKIISVDKIAKHVQEKEGKTLSQTLKKKTAVKRGAQSRIPTKYGEFQIIAFESPDVEHAYLALVKGNVKEKENVLARIHSECLTGDALHSLRCDCGIQLEKSLEIVGQKEGVLIYSRQEGRGIGLLNKVAAYALQDQGLDTVEANRKLGFTADLRDYGTCAKILQDLQVKSIRLLTNNPLKVKGLEKYDVKVTQRVPLEIEPSNHNKKYITTKKEKLGHQISNV